MPFRRRGFSKSGYGLEVGGRWQLGGWLFADADATFTHAEYRINAGNGDAVALAPTRTFTAGVGAMRKLGDWTPFGSIRVKSIADRPATQDGTLVAQGFTLVNAQAGARWRDLEIALFVESGGSAISHGYAAFRT